MDLLTAKLDEAERKLASQSSPSLSTRERESLLKLVIGMAIDGYGYEPDAGRSPVAGQLSGYLQKQGLSLSDDTIRSYLNEAKELLPGVLTE